MMVRCCKGGVDDGRVRVSCIVSECENVDLNSTDRVEACGNDVYGLGMAAFEECDLILAIYTRGAFGRC